MILTGKTIMIFGAGINQLELIRESRKLGLTTVVLDPQDDPPGMNEADFFYCVASDDYAETLRISLKHKINGIVTGQMEKPLRIMSRLAKDLGLIFNSPETTERCLDKWEMKQALAEGHVPFAKGFLIQKGSREKIFIPPKNPGFPVIIKPRDAFSSRGVCKVNSLDELKKYYKESSSFSSTGDVIIEEFLEGKEYSVETITYQGVTTIIQFTEKFITPFPRTVEMGHLQPARINESCKTAVEKTVKNAIKALGIINSAGHVEVMVKGNEVCIIEVGARLGGDFISSYLTKSSTGVSMDRAAIQVSLGIKPDISPGFKKYSYIKYLKLPVGNMVQKILPIDDITGLPGVMFAYIFIKEGTISVPVTHSGERAACFIVSGNNLKEIKSFAKRAEEKVRSKIVLHKN